MIAKIILENNLICNRTNKNYRENENAFKDGHGNFENSQFFEPKKRTIQAGKKRCIASSDLFSPLSDMLLMLMTDFLQRTALNQCHWCGMEGNRCGRHVLDH